MLDSDARGRVRFSFKSKHLGQQKLKNTVYSLVPGEMTECSEVNNFIRSHWRVVLGLGRTRVKELDLLLLHGIAHTDREKWHLLSIDE